MISNQDNYLFLKQILVVLQAQRNGVDVGLNAQPLDIESTSQVVLSKLIDIEDEFTIPRFIDNTTNGTTIDFETVIEAIEFWTGDLRDADLPNNEAMQLIMEVDKPDNLYNSITQYPLLTCYDQHKENVNEGILFPFTTETAVRAANAVDGALSFINKWVVEDLSYYSLGQLIILLNCVQTLDEMFQFGNDSYIGC